MHLLHSAVVLLALGTSGAILTSNQSSSPAACPTWASCRDLALAAREAGDAETFHDLAWRAVQTRGRRDPELLFILARAQSVSGRPHDALVTLQRLASELGVAHDVSEDEDFRRVRALPGWPDLQAAIARVAETSSPAVTPAAARDNRNSEKAPADPPRDESVGAARAAGTAGTPRRPAARIDEVARFAAPRFSPGGLAYDAVSNRFVVGNLPERKLTIVAQGTNRSATLAGEAARLRGVRAIEIDRRSGELWVVSGAQDERAAGSSELHKLQLISGRVLRVFSPPTTLGPSRFVDVAVSRENGVLVLDAEGPRLLRPTAEGQSLKRVIDLPAGTVTSLAPSDDGRSVYIAYTDRLLRVDLQGRTTSRVSAERGAELGGFNRLRWYRGTLVGVRGTKKASEVVRLRLAAGNGAVSRVEMLDSIEGSGAPLALDVLGSDVYYLVPGTPEAVIRRITLK